MRTVRTGRRAGDESVDGMKKTVAKKQTGVTAIIVAAGTSRRMNGVNKIFTPINGRPLISYSVAAFEASPVVDGIVLVLHADAIKQGEALKREFSWSKVTAIVAGGERRQDSVKNGLAKAKSAGWIMVHDGARPCVDSETIVRGLEAAKETGAAIAAMQAKDTVKSVSAKNTVVRTLDRTKLWMVQTPQVFSRDVIMQAYENADTDVTDDAMLVEQTGVKVKVFQGSDLNTKVTTMGDLMFVEAILAQTAPVNKDAPRRTGKGLTAAFWEDEVNSPS